MVKSIYLVILFQVLKMLNAHAETPATLIMIPV